MKVVITIEVPTGADVTFADSEPDPKELAAELDSIVAEQPTAPLPVQQIIPPYQPVTTTRVNPTCPTHHTSKFVPAGTSKKTGKAYKPFWGCTEMDCRWTQDA
jgi:hypothetical protein